MPEFRPHFTSHHLIIALCALFGGITVYAAEYTLQPSLLLRGSYNDNVRMRFDDEEETTGYEIIPRLTLNYDDEISVLNLQTEASFDRFDLSRYDTDDHAATLYYQRRLEKGSLSANLKTEHTSIRSLEDLDSDIGSIEEEASRAEAHSLVLSASYSPGEKSFLQGSLSGQERNYSSDQRRGYEYYSANGLWQVLLNERLRLQAQASYSRYIPDTLFYSNEQPSNVGLDYSEELFDELSLNGLSDQQQLERLNNCASQASFFGIDSLIFVPSTNVGNAVRCFEQDPWVTEQNTVDLKVGFVYNLTEKLSLDILIGGSETGGEVDSFSVLERGKFISRSKNHSSSFDVSLNYNGEKHTSSLQAFRSNEVTTDGLLRLSTRAELFNSWSLTEKSTLKLDLIWFQRERELDLTTTSLEDETTYIYRTEFRHRLTQHWVGSVKYQHRVRTIENVDGSAHRDLVFLTLSWTPTPRIW